MEFRDFVIFISVLQLSVSVDDVWFPYQFESVHQNREEFVVTNVTSSDKLKLDFKVTKWKSLCLEKTCYLAGLMQDNIGVATIKLEDETNLLLHASYEIALNETPLDIALFQNWNTTFRKQEVIAVVATKDELTWYRLDDTEYSKFWSWPLQKTISHLNIFEQQFDKYLLVVNKYLSETTADLYQIEVAPPNFWLRQKLHLDEDAQSATIIETRAETFIAVPQKSQNTLLIYQFANNRFISYQNFSSNGVDQVISFKIGHESFLAFNGINAGIYRFRQDTLMKENLTNSHFDRVNYWLPTPINYDETVLVAQRSLVHGLHKSFVIEIITYNGDRFEEHEDIPCFYFGEESLGLACLPGEENEKGVEGGTSFALGNMLGLLIPRDNSTSELFLVTFSRRKTTNPVTKELEEFAKMQDYLNNLIQSQEEIFKEVVKSPQHSDEIDAKQMKLQLEEMTEAIKNAEAHTNSRPKSIHYDTLVFNGRVEIRGDLVSDEVEALNIDGKPTEEVLNDIVLKNNMGTIGGLKILSNVKADNIEVEELNEIPMSNLIFDRENITLVGDLILEEPLIVLGNVTAGKVNGMVFEEEVVDFGSPINELAFEKVEVTGNLIVELINNETVPPLPLLNEQGVLENLELDSLHIPDNVTAVNVNGENFEEFLKQLCVKNIDTYIPGTLEINGTITVKELITEQLNNLKFPEEYVLRNWNFPNITGAKFFANTLIVDEVNSRGTVDGVNTTEIITLSTNQTIPGSTTFEHLKVSEKLQVENFTGEHIKKFVPNPTLLDTNNLTAKVNFKNLKIDGSIILSGNFDGRSFYDFLDDKIYNDQDEVVVESLKQFTDRIIVRKNLEVRSNGVNGFDLDSFVTKNTEQTLNITTLTGVVSFENVEVGGLYDGVDIKALDDNVVKLNGEQYISSTLAFDDNLTAKEVEVLKTINGVPIEEFLRKRNFVELDENFDFGSLNFSTILIDGNLDGEIANFDLHEFEKNRLSFTEDQRIDSDFHIEKAFIKNVKPIKVNDVDLYDLSQEGAETYIKLRVLQGLVEVKDAFVNGSVEVSEINNESAIGFGGSLWSNDITKYNMSTLHFKDDVFFNKVEIKKLSGVDFDEFMSNLVFKNETNVAFTECKTFSEGITVTKFIETEKLNNVLLDNILTKYGKQEIEGPINIQGDVVFKNNVTITDQVNGVPMSLITETYRSIDNNFFIKGDVLFERLSHIYNLDIKGHVGDRLAQDVVDNIVYKDRESKIVGETIFGDHVTVDGNARISGKIDGVDLHEFVSNVVMITKDADISGLVHFQEEVLVENRIEVETDVEAEVKDFDIAFIENSATFVDKGLLKGNYEFEDVVVVDNLQIDYFNDVDMRKLIQLRTNGNLSELTIDEATVLNNIDVGGSVNGYNLPEELENTVFINSDQEIESDVEFLGDVYVEGDVELRGLMNEMPTSSIVTTNTDQDLYAQYDFKTKTNIEGDLIVGGLVDGINITEWYLSRVKLVDELPQDIYAPWVIEQDLIFNNKAEGRCVMNGVDLKEFAQEVQEKRRYKYGLEKGYIEDYRNMCKDLNYMYTKLKKQIYKFDYFEKLQMLEFDNNICHVFDFNYKNRTYVIISEDRNCKSHLFLFDSHFRFVKTVDFGVVSQIIKVRDNDLLYLVVRNKPVYSLCKVQGTNLWQVIDNGFVRVSYVEEQDLLQESLVPGVFYGIRGHRVMEYKVSNVEPILKKYRKWSVQDKNMAFVPGGLKTGLALRTGQKLIRLYRDDEVDDYFSYDTESVIKGNFSEEFNTHLPGLKNSDLAVMTVGTKTSKRTLLAVASYEETSVMGSLDSIKIYEDVVKGKVFHKVATYKPSSLVSLEFHNGETLLAFMEDESVLQVYEYKGIEGFKHKLSAKLEASNLSVITLNWRGKDLTLLGVVHRNKINFMEAMMLGNQIEKNLECPLL